MRDGWAGIDFLGHHITVEGASSITSHVEVQQDTAVPAATGQKAASKLSWFSEFLLAIYSGSGPNFAAAHRCSTRRGEMDMDSGNGSSQHSLQWRLLPTRIQPPIYAWWWMPVTLSWERFYSSCADPPGDLSPSSERPPLQIPVGWSTVSHTNRTLATHASPAQSIRPMDS